MKSIDFGRIIRKNRKEQGLKQAQLAAAAGVGIRFLVDLEKGKPTARLGMALAILDALGCQIEIHSPDGRRQ